MEGWIIKLYSKINCGLVPDGTEVDYVVWYKILHIPLTIPHTIPDAQT